MRPCRLSLPLSAIAVALSWSAVASANVGPVAGPAPGPTLCLAIGLEYGAQPATGTLAGPAETDCRRFLAAAGDRVRVRVTGSAAPRVELPACGLPAAPELTCTVAGGGYQTLLVRGAQAGGYTLTVQRLSDPAGCSALAYGPATRTGAIVAGETECRRFEGAAGHRVRLRLVTPSGLLAPRAEVLRPDGTTRCAATGSTDSTCVLDAAGTHTVLVRDAGAQAGGYALGIQRLEDPAGCQAKQFGTYSVPGAIATSGETDCWRFQGTAGQRIRVRVVKTAGALDPAFEVLRPNGTTHCQGRDETTCQLTITGTHAILVRHAGMTALGDYRIHLQRFPDPALCSDLPYGEDAAGGSLATAETDCWRIGAAGRVRVRVVATTGALVPIAELVDTAGETECGPAHGGELGCGPGARTILVRDSIGTRGGDYRISAQRLDAPAGCSGNPWPSGTDGWAGVAGIECWRFDGDDGELMRIRVIDTGWSWDPVMEVLRPDGSTVCAPTSLDSSTCELDADGEHTILVRHRDGTRYGGYRLAMIQLDGAPHECPMLATSPPAHNAWILHAGQVDCFTSWDAEAGARSLRVEATSGTLDPTVEVLRPNGSARCIRSEPEDWFDCYGDIYEYQRILVYDASGLGTGGYEIDRR